MKQTLQFLSILALILFSYQSMKAQETIIEQDWVKTYSSQDSIYNQATAIDVNGNVYVTGFTYNSATQADITTIKYSDTGTQLWVQTFNGTGNKNDRATGIGFDSFGNIYVCGFTTNSNNNSDFILIKYNSNGVQQWIETYDYNGNDKANSIVIDNSNNIYVTGYSEDTDNDFLTIKYDQNGNQIWNNRKNFGSNDRAQSIEIYNNNLYISGTAEIADYDFAIISYNLNGTELWSTSVTSAVGNWDFAKDLTVNSNGLFITGYSQNYNVYQYFTVNYSLTGVLNWRKQYRSYGNWNIANSICSDNFGNIYIVGSTRNANTSTITTIKYDQNGNEQWLQNHYMSGNIEKYQPSIICDNNNGIYIAGTVNNGNPDFCTIKYDYNGNELWSETYNGNYNGSDVAADLTISTNGDIYVTGQTYNGNNYDFCTIKYTNRVIFIPEDNQLDPVSNNYVFYQNKGQIRDIEQNLRPDIKFYTTTVNPKIYISENGLHYVFSTIDNDTLTIDTICRVDMTLDRSNKTKLSYFEPIDAKLNYYLGFIPEGRTNITGYKRIVQPNVYDKIDLHYYSNHSGFKYYFVVNPNGNANDIKMKFVGADTVKITSSGKLSIETLIGKKQFEKATVYRVTPSGNTIPMLSSGNFYFDSSGNVKINVNNYPSNNTLIIAIKEGYSTANTQNLENILWSTYYGGDGYDFPNKIETSDDGKKAVIGHTYSYNFPISPSYSESTGNVNAYLSIFNNENTLIFSAVYGSGNCGGKDLAFGKNNDILIVGTTYNSSIPLKTSDFYSINDATFHGSSDWFIAQFDYIFNELKWGTYFGGSSGDNGRQILFDNNDNLYVIGSAHEGIDTYEKTNAYNAQYIGGYIFSTYILKFDNSGNIDWGTYYNGEGEVFPYGAYIDNYNNLYITGEATGELIDIDNPIGAWEQDYSDSFDGFVLKFNDSGNLDWGTCFGGSDDEDLQGNNLIVDNYNRIIIVGTTLSNDLQTCNPLNYSTYNASPIAGADGFIMQFSHNYQLEWSTYYGGTGDDQLTSLDIVNNNLIVVGYSTSLDLDVTGPTGTYLQQSFIDNNYDAVISVLDNNRNIEWLTYFGGGGSNEDHANDVANSISVYNDKLFITGITYCQNNDTNYNFFPIIDYGNNSYYQETYLGGGFDGYISMFDLTPLVSVPIIQKSNFNFNIYPNPTKDKLNIDISQINIKDFELEIFDITGKSVMKFDKIKQQNFTINVNKLPNGVFLIKLKNSNNIYTTKFIKN